jgi:mRNA interferase RelE/StbE
VSDQPTYHTVELSPAAERVLRKLDKPTARRLAIAIAALGRQPRPAASTPQVGHPGVLRRRVGDYRIVFRIEDNRLVVLVLDIGHRRDIYRDCC